MSLFSTAERFSQIDRSVVTFVKESCLHSQNRFSGCEACFSVCPVSAIQHGKPPVLVTENCENCLVCIQTCPVDAYSADDGIQALLTCVARLETTHIELLCEKNPYGEQGYASDTIGVQVHGCLAGLGVGALMALVALGMDSIMVRTDACSECAWGMLQTLIDEHIAQTQNLLSAWNKATIIESISNIQETHVRPLWNAKNPPISRRDLFRLASRQGQIALARSIEQKKPGQNHTPGHERRRIINAVEHLSVSKAENDPILAGNSYAALSVSDSCTACGVCARACPTSALHYTTNPEKTTFQLTISTQYCIGCELCTFVCAPNAVVVDHAPSFNKVFGLEIATILREGELAKCEKCNGAYASISGTRFCPACDYRQKNPFGSIMPSGIKIPPQNTPGGRYP